MKTYNPKIHNRQSYRLKNYDYSQEGLYFITINCQDRTPYFGKIIDGEMHLNEFGRIAQNEWLNSSNVRDNVRLHEFIIMPDHIHGIIEITFKKGNNAVGEFQSPSQTVGSIVRGFKIATIKRCRDLIQLNPNLPLKLWQRNYYDVIIRDHIAYFRISEYIRNNPRK